MIETARRTAQGYVKPRQMYRYTIEVDGRKIIVSRWRTSKPYTEAWAKKNIRTLEETPCS